MVSSISHTSETVWDDEAYKHLALETEKKDIILSSVQIHKETMELGADIIQGKGKIQR